MIHEKQTTSRIDPSYNNQIVSWILPVWIAVDPACVWLWLWIDPACVCRLLCLSASGLLNILSTKLEDQWTRDWVDHHTWSIKPPFFLCLVVNITYISGTKSGKTRAQMTTLRREVTWTEDGGWDWLLCSQALEIFWWRILQYPTYVGGVAPALQYPFPGLHTLMTKNAI
jgi:hypothetical protein